MSLAATARIGGVVVLALQFCVGAFASPLEAGIQRKVRDATFEVVLPKPAQESVTYDKPWQELIPYQARSDKYVSMGTAFAIGPNLYATAMHVLIAAFGDSRGEPMLRDANGSLYPIAQITKGSTDQDFAVFTLAKPPDQAAFLELNDKPELNETVYAVGNALGEGVVMREGNYTSDTPEEESGRWKWMRFSAPISGGNSGGPLIDARGRVIGLVRAMRTSENTLNIAVPAALVKSAPDHVVSADSRAVAGFAVFDKTRAGRFKADIPAPKRFAELAAAYMKAVDDFNAGQLRGLLADNANETFPRGSGSERLLHGLYERSAPAIVVQNGNGNWTFTQPSYTRLDLGREGWQDSANFKGYLVFHRHKPDDINQARWYADAQMAREVVLKASPATIHINAENAKVVSMGAPTEDSLFTDTWGRVWQMRVWHVTTWFGSDWLVEFDLPVPDGSVGFESRVSTLGRNFQIERMKLLTGFFAASYEGKLSQWDGFLSQKPLLPKALAASVLHVDYGRSFAFDDRHVAFSYGPELQKIDQGSRLRLDFAFTREPAGALLDIAGIVAYNADEKTEVDVFRHGTPAEAGSEAAKTEWRKRIHHAHPYDAVALTANGRQIISTIYGVADAQPDPDVLYTFQYRAETGTPQEQMKAKLDLLMQQAKVNER
ncbi:S1 family peptidase [Roseateles sp.]|uniref:S1 family peptidase n=1 Tax=Roseateles sp. TaxID=1971397 RepID=UPI003BA89602